MLLSYLAVLCTLELLTYSESQNIVYIAATENPPHGCPNYGLCTDVTITLVSETNLSVIYQYDCSPENCVCVDGVTNTTSSCDTIIDQCTNDPCGPPLYFSCSTGIDSFSCSCQPGFTGNDCSSAIGSACASSPCQNNATCTSNSSVYTCSCKTGFFGDNCEYKDTCYNINCNNGSCIRVLNNSKFYCQCDAGFQGGYCQYPNSLSTAPVMDGCYIYDTVSIGSVTTKFSDSKMTIEMCNSYASSQTEEMSYLTLCGAWCMVSAVPIVNTTASATDSDCNKKCGGNSSELCGKLNSRCMVYEAGVIEEDPNPCTNTSLCNAIVGNGICVNWRETTGDGYACLCGALWTGRDCETPVAPACTPDPCINGTCLLQDQFNTYSCTCEEGFVGTNCEYGETCTSTTCLYGGTCEETSTGSYNCLCLSLYSGQRCDEINRCKYSNPCVNGDCSATVDGITPDYTCTCKAGWTGVDCDEMINYCEPNPCDYNSTCSSFFKGYNCSCLVGLTGSNCSTIIDLCVGAWVDGKWIKSPCNTKDDAANCTKGINTFTCSCSDKWTDSLCDLNVLIKDVLMAIYGYVDLNMITLLNDLMQNPSEIKDMVPFITGLLTDSERSDLSWNVEDIFNWIVFEDKRLDLKFFSNCFPSKTLKFRQDIYEWNDVVLGNCFTFNHREQNFTYLMRSSGKQGGILAFMRTRQDEYAPWYDTAAINVFIHNREEYVFSESVRYNAQPNAHSAINIFTTRYTRLGGKYGKCVNEVSEVKNYYYPGSYTTDGCLRTCYQDMIMIACECMDPRYPKANNATPCELSERSCVTEASDSSGDPSTWPSCVCPLPCSNQEYSVTWSKADFVKLPISCAMSSDVAACQTQYLDNLMISLLVEQLDFKIYAETAAMDFNKFLSQLGGQLGVLMGINLVTFIEVLFLFFGVVIVCLKKKE